MRYELIKKREPQGDVYYYIHENGERLSDLTLYGGNEITSDPEFLQKKENQANDLYDAIIKGKIASVPILTVLKTDEI